MRFTLETTRQSSLKSYDDSIEDYTSGIFDYLPNNESHHPFSTEFNLLEEAEKFLSIIKNMFKEQFLS